MNGALAGRTGVRGMYPPRSTKLDRSGHGRKPDEDRVRDPLQGGVRAAGRSTAWNGLRLCVPG